MSFIKSMSGKDGPIYILMGLSFLLWIYLFRGFFLSTLTLSSDAASYHYWIKFYLDNIIHGVYPMWNPLENWGYPIAFKIRFIGEFNPILNLAFIPYLLGANYNAVYFCYAVFYYFLGVVGFFLLSKRFFNSTQLAFFAFVLFLFSSTGFGIFVNYCEVVLLVPGIWFFYFLLAFTQNRQKKYFLGLTLSLMIIMITYMPFYFLTIFFVFLICFFIIYFKDIKGICIDYLKFFKTHKIFTLFCLIALLCSVIPGLIWYLENSSSEMTYPFRQGDSSDATHFASASLKTINSGGIAGLVTFRRLFSGLAYQKNYLAFYFLSVFIFPIVLCSFINRLNKRLILLFVIGLFVFLFSMTNASWVHRFLYDHVFFIKLIRNIFYFLYLAVPIFILFIVEQLRLLLNLKLNSTKQKFSMVVFLMVIHSAFTIFLYNFGTILVTSYLTVWGSFIFFMCYFLGQLRRHSKAMIIFLFFLIGMQPVEVFYHYGQFSAEEKTISKKIYRAQLKFHYQRPELGEDLHYPENEMEDGHGFVPNRKFAGVGWVYLFQEQINNKLIKDYVKNKFVIYDQTLALDDADSDWTETGLSLYMKSNLAYVFEPTQKGISLNDSSEISPKAQIIHKDDERFQILNYSLNSIRFKTDFDKRKFIVYNDSYHSGWKARINNLPAKIYRANIAFKGLWLKPGENIVELRFGSKGLHSFYIFLIFLFIGILLYLLWSFRPKYFLMRRT